MMALSFPTKKAAKEALALRGHLNELDIIETSFFGKEYKDGKHAVVVSKDPWNVRNSFAEITIKDGRIVAIK
jgi:hypothetical protein